jgi:hypothetical protein
MLDVIVAREQADESQAAGGVYKCVAAVMNGCCSTRGCCTQRDCAAPILSKLTYGWLAGWLAG